MNTIRESLIYDFEIPDFPSLFPCSTALKVWVSRSFLHNASKIIAGQSYARNSLEPLTIRQDSIRSLFPLHRPSSCPMWDLNEM